MAVMGSRTTDCRDCGGQVSYDSVRCPHCGCQPAPHVDAEEWTRRLNQTAQEWRDHFNRDSEWGVAETAVTVAAGILFVAIVYYASEWLGW